MRDLSKSLFALTASLLVMTAGCVTPKIDWGGRVGHYTFDQAVIELGPPDKQAKLGDGTVVADWITRRGYSRAYAMYGPGYPVWYPGPVYPEYVETTAPDFYLRLIFGPDGQLSRWKKFAK